MPLNIVNDIPENSDSLTENNVRNNANQNGGHYDYLMMNLRNNLQKSQALKAKLAGSPTTGPKRTEQNSEVHRSEPQISTMHRAEPTRTPPNNLQHNMVINFLFFFRHHNFYIFTMIYRGKSIDL